MTSSYEPLRIDAPPLHDLAGALAGADRCFDRVRTVRAGVHVNLQGGDPSSHGHAGLVLRHLVHYLAATELAEALDLGGPVTDVGSGVGAFGAWAAERLGAPLHVVDHDESVRLVALRAFPTAQVHARIDDAPQGRSALVLAMEVLEHLEPSLQPAFLTALLGLVAPGGLLVLSTPDESGFPGGWSGYAPHIGPVTFTELEHLLRAAAGWPSLVWRLEGPVYGLGRVQRLVLPVANRTWGTVCRAAPALAGRLAGLSALLPERDPSAPEGAIRVTTDPHGTGTGLLAVVRRPESASTL